jgi:hypothetical protein
VECIPVSRGSGCLVEADGLVIFYGGDHLLSSESQRESFNKTIDYLKRTGKKIDLLFLPANFLYGRIFPSNLEGVDYAVKTLKPRAYLASGSESTEFVLSEVIEALEMYKNQTKIFCPEHRGDMFRYSPSTVQRRMMSSRTKAIPVSLSMFWKSSSGMSSLTATSTGRPK